MPVLISIIVVAFILYIYFKVRIFNYRDPLYMHYTNGKARIALGIFIGTFGVNQYLFYQTQLVLFICIIFLAFGVAQMVYGYKVFKHYKDEILKADQSD